MSTFAYIAILLRDIYIEVQNPHVKQSLGHTMIKFAKDVEEIKNVKLSDARSVKKKKKDVLLVDLTIIEGIAHVLGIPCDLLSHWIGWIVRETYKSAKERAKFYDACNERREWLKNEFHLSMV